MGVGVAALVCAAAVLLVAPTPGHAQPAAPHADQPCALAVSGALTRSPDGETLLQCHDEPGSGYRWKRFTAVYPSSDRWLTYGPELTLHGQGRRNPEIMSGDWVAYPQDPDSRCRAEQVAVVGAGEVGAPEVTTGEPGQPLAFRVPPTLFSVELAGHCLWRKVA
jgi:hypothetical protein